VVKREIEKPKQLLNLANPQIPNLNTVGKCSAVLSGQTDRRLVLVLPGDNIVLSRNILERGASSVETMMTLPGAYVHLNECPDFQPVQTLVVKECIIQVQILRDVLVRKTPWHGICTNREIELQQVPVSDSNYFNNWKTFLFSLATLLATSARILAQILSYVMAS
jgi:hypothetical protein